ncbi:MAG: prephenate dehydrogenase/arogenate dehydrogenase family protein [Halieaceae bacterium]|jgi:3-phosphoshikimate 1-carboxyvinyltransferase|nr:prephenate dehydrogenase/arogenate dehydrogenase family protein [Halieaceae bacterium]
MAAVVGLGLIGGSVARCLRGGGQFEEVVGFDGNAETLAQALELGVIDRAADSLEQAVAAASLVVLAVPTRTAERLLPAVLSMVPDTAVITDVASVKGNLVAAAGGAANYVGGHPIAGSERSGVAASSADLFREHRVILTPTDNTATSALATVRALWEAAGAEVVLLAPAAHDAILAATSHLPHMLAYALVDALSHSQLSDDIFRFAAGGFRDFTRIASSDPVMWRDIALANRDELLRAIDTFDRHLASLRRAVEGGDATALEHCFADARAARERFIKQLAG